MMPLGLWTLALLAASNLTMGHVPILLSHHLHDIGSEFGLAWAMRNITLEIKFLCFTRLTGVTSSLVRISEEGSLLINLDPVPLSLECGNGSQAHAFIDLGHSNMKLCSLIFDCQSWLEVGGVLPEEEVGTLSATALTGPRGLGFWK
jgi:hypothetical protein